MDQSLLFKKKMDFRVFRVYRVYLFSITMNLNSKSQLLLVNNSNDNRVWGFSVTFLQI